MKRADRKGLTIQEVLSVVMVVLVLIVAVPMLYHWGCQYTTRHFGGRTTSKLPPGYKLVGPPSWKSDDLWFLLREMEPGEKPKTYIFQEESGLTAMQGKVTIIEQAAK